MTVETEVPSPYDLCCRLDIIYLHNNNINNLEKYSRYLEKYSCLFEKKISFVREKFSFVRSIRIFACSKNSPIRPTKSLSIVN